MGLENIIQFMAKEDGCIYFYDENLKTWKKICDIKSLSDLPLSVREQIREAQNNAEHILRLPI